MKKKLQTQGAGLQNQIKNSTTVNPLLSPPGGLFFSSTFEGGLNREGGLINFPPLKRGGLIREGGLNRGFRVI